MKPSVPLAAGVLALWLAAPPAGVAAEQPPSLTSLLPADPLDALQKALRNEREARARTGGTTGMGSGREMYETRSYLEGIRQAMSRGEDNNALSALNQIEAASSSEEVRRACEALVDKINKERIAREQAFATELDVAVKRAGEVVLRAKEPKELDGLIADFGRLQESRISSDGRDNRTQQKIQGAVTFLNRWQEYLAAQAKGDDQAAANALRSLGENGYNQTLLIPRSEMLARMPNTGDSSTGRNRLSRTEVNAAVADLLERTRTLDDIPATLGKLNELAARNGNNANFSDGSTDLGAAVGSLQAIQKTRAELQAGMATTINLNTLRGSNDPRSAFENKLTGLRAELIKMALPRLLGAADEKPVEGEGVSEFLHRLMDRAKKRAEWAMVTRGLDMDRNLASGMNNYSAVNNQEAEAYRQFFAGMNLEAAGQYTQAVIAYLSALKSGAQDVPATVIGEHLSAIEKAHPKEFAEANAHVLNPPPQNYPYGPAGGGDPRLRRGGYVPGMPEQPTPATTITVPATATPAAAPVATPTPSPKVSP